MIYYSIYGESPVLGMGYMTYYTEDICSKLKKSRRKVGLSQKALGSLAGIPQSHVSKIENNDVDMRVSSLAAVSHALGLELVLVPRRAILAVRATIRKLQKRERRAPPVSNPLVTGIAYRAVQRATDCGCDERAESRSGGAGSVPQELQERSTRLLEAVAHLVAVQRQAAGQTVIPPDISLKISELSERIERAAYVGEQIAASIILEKNDSCQRVSSRQDRNDD